MKRFCLIIVASLALAGCVREIDIENQPAEITSVGSLSLDTQQNVIVPFTVRDLEGDDQIVTIEVCDAPDENCGVAAEGIGGDPLDRTPTVPKNTDVLHEFVWAAWCGRWLDGQLEPAALDDEFVVSVSVLPSGSEPVYSDPTSLATLGALEGTCE